MRDMGSRDGHQNASMTGTFDGVGAKQSDTGIAHDYSEKSRELIAARVETV